MALIITAKYTGQEAEYPNAPEPTKRYCISLVDDSGFPARHSFGATREMAILGLTNSGYTVTETTQE